MKLPDTLINFEAIILLTTQKERERCALREGRKRHSVVSCAKWRP
jgi:hypothetical protein